MPQNLTHTQYLRNKRANIGYTQASRSPLDEKTEPYIHDEIPPASTIPSDVIDTSEIHEKSFWDDLERAGKKAWQAITDIMKDTIHIKPYDQLSEEEKRERWRRWRKQMKESHIPPWARKIQKYVTVLDNIEDGLSTISSLSRLASFLVPEAAPILMTISGVADLIGLGLDIPKDLMASAIGPMGWKAAGEDLGKLLHPKKALKMILKKEVPKTLRKALPSFGELLEIAQTADNLTGRGLCLGPIMGALSNLWFSALEKVGIIHPQHPKDTFPKKPRTTIRRHNMPTSRVPRRVYRQDIQTGVRRIENLRIPKTAHSPIEFETIPIGVEGYFDQPNEMELLALKIWAYTYHILAHPGGIDEHLIYEAIVAHATSLPWAWEWLNRNEWWKLAEIIGPMEPFPEMPWPSEAQKWLEEEGYDPNEPIPVETATGEKAKTYDECIIKSSEYITYRLNAFMERHKGDKQNFVMKACIAYIADVYAHALQPSPIETTKDGTTLYRVTEIHMGYDAFSNALRNLGRCGIEVPEDITEEEWRLYLKRIHYLIKALDRQPKCDELYREAPWYHR